MVTLEGATVEGGNRMRPEAFFAFFWVLIFGRPRAGHSKHAVLFRCGPLVRQRIGRLRRGVLRGRHAVRPLLVVEAAYPWTLEAAADSMSNLLELRLQVNNVTDESLRIYRDNDRNRIGRYDEYGRRYFFDVALKF